MYASFWSCDHVSHSPGPGGEVLSGAALAAGAPEAAALAAGDALSAGGALDADGASLEAGGLVGCTGSG
jgi:hypothetical protein